jgi:hypothetical protein
MSPASLAPSLNHGRHARRLDALAPPSPRDDHQPPRCSGLRLGLATIAVARRSMRLEQALAEHPLERRQLLIEERLQVCGFNSV